MRHVRKNRQFQIRELAALTAGVAFACWCFAWLGRPGDTLSVSVFAAWAAGSTVGIFVTRRFTSVVVGALLGGSLFPMLVYAVATACGPGVFYVTSLFYIWAFATAASAIHAAIMGIIGEGLTIHRRRAGNFSIQSTSAEPTDAR